MTTKRRQARLMTKEQLQEEAKDRIRAKQTRIDKSKLAVAYGRQSTQSQTVHKKESALTQRDDLIAYAIRDYQWPEHLVLLFIENELDKYGKKMENGKMRSASGRLDTIFRPGLLEVERLIEADKVGAVFVLAISRLFRDEDMLAPTRFANLCKKHHVVIITFDQEYDFNATARDDLKDFLEEAQDAADYLKWQRKTMLRARDRKGMRGEYAGHAVATGFMLDDRRREYIPNPIWAPIVAQLTKRFRVLDGSVSMLHDEIRGRAIFPELPDDIKARVGHIRLRPVPGGYTIAKRENLVALLINPANVGHKVFKQRIVKRDAYPAIVDLEDYQFALQRLGTVDLDGNPIEHTPRVKRYTQHGNRRDGLLAGVRSDGRAVVTSYQGSVYVLQRRDNPPAYVIENNKDISANPFKGSISVSTLDAVISARIEEKLHTLLRHAEGDIVSADPARPLNGGSPVLDDMLGKVQAMHQTEKIQSRAMVDHIAKLRQQVKGDLQKIGETIIDIEKKIALEIKDYDVAREVMSDADIKAHFTTLARLRNRLADLKDKQQEITQGDAEIVTTMSRLERARQEWATMTIEQKRACIRLMTNTVIIDAFSDHWLKVIIEWNPILSEDGSGEWVDYAIVLRGNGAGRNWTPDEDAILHDMYPHGAKWDILCALPKRSWWAIRKRATLLQIARYGQEMGAFTQEDTVSIEDTYVMNEHLIPIEEKRAGVKVWWRVALLSTINSACYSRAPVKQSKMLL